MGKNSGKTEYPEDHHQPRHIICNESAATPGDIVYSIAGRDKSNHFVVMKVEDGYAFVCDGRKRKIDSQKRKKLKHLLLGVGHSTYVASKLNAGDKVTNAEVRRELDEYNQ